MIWIAVGGLVLVIIIAGSRRARYWRWVQSKKDPGERMQAEMLYRGWLRSKKRG